MHSRPSSLSFGSFLVYPSLGKSPELARFKADVIAIKEDRVRQGAERWPDDAAAWLVRELPGSALEHYFDGDPWFVPLPRSGLLAKDSLWPAKRIAEALASQGIGARVECALKRQTAVHKSAGGASRPSPATHHRSFGPFLPLRARSIILVDDVVTRGSTALGAAWRILEVMPEADVKLFAMARTVPDVKVRGFVELVSGRITLDPGKPNWLTRDP